MVKSSPLQRCPICDRLLSDDPESRRQFQPFCSERCRQVDLVRWLDGKYAIVEPLPDDALTPGPQIDEETE